MLARSPGNARRNLFFSKLFRKPVSGPCAADGRALPTSGQAACGERGPAAGAGARALVTVLRLMY
jgi:hypothetical protein